MRALIVTITLLSFPFLTACSGGGGGSASSNSDIEDTSNTASNTGNDSGTSGSGNSSGGSTPPPQPTGPQPGDLVASSVPAPNATYPAVGQPLLASPDPNIEPNTDYDAPIIEILTQPNPYIPSITGSLQLAAADNIGGMGLKEIQCSLDGATWTVCNESVQLDNLSEGLHTIKARAEDWDGNQSTEVSYTFYVDTTGPAVQIKDAPQPATRDAQATIDFDAQDAGSGVAYYECKLDNGQIQRCNPGQSYQNLTEGNHNVEVTAVDAVGNQSPVDSHQWLVDYSAPIISVNTQPASQVYVDDPDPIVNFNVADQYSPNGITLTCTLNGVVVSCTDGANLVAPSTQPTTYVLQITATDVLGNTTTQTIQWATVNEAENRQTNVNVKDVRPVDILFVVDNSGSMNEERANLAQRIDGMINVIDGLDWQIGVISTDAITDNAISNGRLIEMIGLPGQYILDSSMDVNTAQAVFGNTVQNFGGGSGREEGIRATSQLLDRYISGGSVYQQFLRDGADFSVVVLSDEDENSNGSSLVVTPQQLINKVNSTFNNQKNFVWHSIIYRPGDIGCTTGYSEGNTYDALSRLTGFGQVGGAIIGDVCSQDYTSQLHDIGQSVKDLQNSIKLQCSPFDLDKDGVPEIMIQHRADAQSSYAPFTAPYTVQADRLVFNALLPSGDFQVDYRCKVN